MSLPRAAPAFEETGRATRHDNEHCRKGDAARGGLEYLKERNLSGRIFAPSHAIKNVVAWQPGLAHWNHRESCVTEMKLAAKTHRARRASVFFARMLANGARRQASRPIPIGFVFETITASSLHAQALDCGREIDARCP